MPTYEFSCEKCGRSSEQQISLLGRNAAPPTSIRCTWAGCAGLAHRVFSSLNIAVNNRERIAKTDPVTGEKVRVPKGGV